MFPEASDWAMVGSELFLKKKKKILRDPEKFSG